MPLRKRTRPAQDPNTGQFIHGTAVEEAGSGDQSFLDDETIFSDTESLRDGSGVEESEWESEDDEEEEWKRMVEERDRAKKRRAAKKLAKLQQVSQKSAEWVLDGPIDRAQGAHDKTGKKRGFYHGEAERTIRHKKRKILDEAKACGLDINSPEIQRRLAALTARPPPKGKQLSLAAFFSRLPAAAPEASSSSQHAEVIEIS